MHSPSSPVTGGQDNAIDDAVLVRAARRDPAAFAAPYRRYVTQIYRYLYSRVGNVADAEDLTAQTFVAVLEGLPGYRERGNFAAWLFTIAHNKAADRHRQQHQCPCHGMTAGGKSCKLDGMHAACHRHFASSDTVDTR